MGKVIGLGVKPDTAADDKSLKAENKKLKAQVKDLEEANAALTSEMETLKAQNKPPEK